MSVYAAVLVELDAWGVVESTDGQRALVLASAMDDRAGVVNLAVTDKRLGELMESLRAVFGGERADSVDDASAAVDEKLRLVR